MTPTADTLVPEQLWQAIQPRPTLPPAAAADPATRYGGRPCVDGRAALAG